MSHNDNFENSADKEDCSPPTSILDNQPENQAGAAYLEITDNQISNPEIQLIFEDIYKEENDDLDDLPLPPPSSPTFPTLCSDLYGQSTFSRRFSCFPTHSDVNTNFHQRSRAPSLPTLGVSQISRQNQESNFKKLLFDSSRRSSFESAYHSHASDRSSRTPIASSQLENLEYSQEYGDTLYSVDNHLMFEGIHIDENLERTMMERRNSLSYEAIRAYFLEFNPYMYPVENSFPCLDHNGSHNDSQCPNCTRRSSIDQTNVHFRTTAHRQIVERQFEDLFNIPDQRRSRATSIDLFGGLGISFPYQDNNESIIESIEDESKNNNDDTVNEP